MFVMYGLFCKKCKKFVSFFTDKVVFDEIHVDVMRFFKFLAYHIKNCGEENIKIISWNAPEWEKAEEIDFLSQKYRNFIENTKNIYVYFDNFLFIEKTIKNIEPNETEYSKCNILNERWVKKQKEILNKLLNQKED